MTASPDFLLSVAAGAGATIMLATLLGLPVSTTHALMGALAGAGFAAVGPQKNLSRLGSSFFAPLLLSPLLAALLTVPLYRTLRALASRLGIRRESCLCVGAREFIPVRRLQYNAALQQYASAITGPGDIAVTLGTQKDCVEIYQGTLLGVSGHSLVNGLHHVSAATVGFARGLNDMPKIVGLLLVVEAMHLQLGMLAIASAMALGGLLNARKVAITMSKKIARMNDGQALTANMVSGLLVIVASRFGLPVSTTHVTVGAISGVGLVNGSADRNVMGSVLASWLLTLPVAAVIGALAFALLVHFR